MSSCFLFHASTSLHHSPDFYILLCLTYSLCLSVSTSVIFVSCFHLHLTQASNDRFKSNSHGNCEPARGAFRSKEKETPFMLRRLRYCCFRLWDQKTGLSDCPGFSQDRVKILWELGRCVARLYCYSIPPLIARGGGKGLLLPRRRAFLWVEKTWQMGGMVQYSFIVGGFSVFSFLCLMPFCY